MKFEISSMLSPAPFLTEVEDSSPSAAPFSFSLDGCEEDGGIVAMGMTSAGEAQGGRTCKEAESKIDYLLNSRIFSILSQVMLSHITGD